MTLQHERWLDLEFNGDRHFVLPWPGFFDLIANSDFHDDLSGWTFPASAFRGPSYVDVPSNASYPFLQSTYGAAHVVGDGVATSDIYRGAYLRPGEWYCPTFQGCVFGTWYLDVLWYDDEGLLKTDSQDLVEFHLPPPGTQWHYPTRNNATPLQCPEGATGVALRVRYFGDTPERETLFSQVGIFPWYGGALSRPDQPDFPVYQSGPDAAYYSDPLNPERRQWQEWDGSPWASTWHATSTPSNVYGVGLYQRLLVGRGFVQEDHFTQPQPFGDGDTPGWEWAGTPGFSASRTKPVRLPGRRSNLMRDTPSVQRGADSFFAQVEVTRGENLITNPRCIGTIGYEEWSSTPLLAENGFLHGNSPGGFWIESDPVPVPPGARIYMGGSAQVPDAPGDGIVSFDTGVCYYTALGAFSAWEGLTLPMPINNVESFGGVFTPTPAAAFVTAYVTIVTSDWSLDQAAYEVYAGRLYLSTVGPGYGDGNMEGWSWSGVADASASSKKVLEVIRGGA